MVAAASVVLALFWSLYDHRFPTADEAAHIINSITAKGLLEHFRPWHYRWWYEVFTISSFYPPFAYVVNGAFLLVFGQSRFVEHVYMAFFGGLMVSSVYGLTRLLHGGRLAAVTSCLYLSAYPLISWLGHTYFLDMPAVAMTALALMTLLWWRTSSNPNLLRTTLCGLVLGAACLTKQMVVAYIVPVTLYFFIVDVTRAFRENNSVGIAAKRWLLHTIWFAAICIFVSSPFVLYSCQLYKGWLGTNVEDFAHAGIHHTFIGNLYYFLGILPSVMSPPLLVVFLMSFLFLRRPEYSKLATLIISTVGGLAFTCTCMGTDLEERYLVPFLIAPAIFSGFLTSALYCSAAVWRRTLGMVLILLAVWKYAVYNYSPYPIPLPEPPSFARCREHNGNPNCELDWGYSLVLETIKRMDGDKIVYLNILSNHETLHIHAFELLLREQGNFAILPTGSRKWTIVGDQVQFDPATAWHFQWYLLKTGRTGFRFCDKQSEREYAKLVDYVRNSGSYKLIVQKPLPDGSELMLYRRTF
jgi:4-amino-4-deoxy-L-arabinose transferase-like glycosyltransferase